MLLFSREYKSQVEKFIPTVYINQWLLVSNQTIVTGFATNNNHLTIFVAYKVIYVNLK